MLCTNLFSSPQVWLKWDKAWTNCQNVENGQNHIEALRFEAHSRSTNLFSVLYYVGWKFRQSPTFPPSAGSDIWRPELETRCCLGARKTAFVKIKVWFLVKHDFELTVCAFEICTPFWPEVAQLTGSCEGNLKKTQDFIIFNRSWWLYVSFMFMVSSKAVFKSNLNVLRIMGVVFENFLKISWKLLLE